MLWQQEYWDNQLIVFIAHGDSHVPAGPSELEGAADAFWTQAQFLSVYPRIDKGEGGLETHREQKLFLTLQLRR